MRRRLLLAAPALLTLPAATSQLNITVTGSGAGGPPTGFPGQDTNPVGYLAAPGYPGALTPHAPSGFQSNATYSFLDIDGGTSGTNLAGLSNVTFIGCRFKSNAQGYFNVYAIGTNLTFRYCTICPRDVYASAPPGCVWPSAGTGQNTTKYIDGVNCTKGTQGYQYGFHIMSGGPITIQYCDIWGFGNAIDFLNTTAQMLVDNCWIHDAANSSPNGYHTDGPGYLNGATPPKNITISNCTIASIGNTNGLAMQAATSAYQNITVTGNFFSGFGYCTAHFQPGSGGARNCTFTDNILATDVAWYFGPIYSNPTSLYNYSSYGNLWRRNKLRVLPGTAPVNGAMFSYTQTDDGKYIWPNASLSTTDYSG
jgi:hypothetical protein